jgi:uncharacterized protein YjbJ (UPF0337 family)
MNLDHTEGNWKQLAGNIKRRLDKLIDGQLDLWVGKRDHPKPVARRQARMSAEMAQVRTNANREHP